MFSEMIGAVPLVLFTTALVFVAWYCLVGRFEGGALSMRCVLAGIGASGQIVLTGMLLGWLGFLTGPATVAVSLLVAGGLLFAGARGGREPRGAAGALPAARLLAAEDFRRL